MPYKNPKCPKCGGRTRFLKSAGLLSDGRGGLTEKVFYICKRGRFGCGFTFIDWAWKARPKPHSIQYK